MEPATLSTKEIIDTFDRYAKEMKEGSSSSKLNISGEMLCLLSNYLVQREETVNTTAILLLLEELANISGGNEPDFIKPTAHNSGRPIKLGDNIRYASIMAAVEIIASSSASLHEALEKVSGLSGLSITRLKQIRKEFRENKRPNVAIAFMQKQIKKQRDEKLEPETYAAALIETAQKKGG